MDKQSHSQIQVVGHNWAIDFLSRQQQAGRVPQALLLSGPQNVGKSTVARFIAQVLNCQTSPIPCGQCLSCRKVVNNIHPDVRIFDDDSRAIKIDEIRALQRELSLSPYEGHYRVAILCNFERATISAANALLKTLEEPASQVVMILTATDPSALLPTIVSRCQAISLRSLPVAQVSSALEERWHAAAEKAELLAHLSAGRLGWAVRALEDENMLARRQDCFDALFQQLHSNRVERLAYAQIVGRSSAVLKETLTIWLTIWRDLLLLQSGGQTRILNIDWQDRLAAIASQTTISQAKEMANRLRTALINLEHNVNPRLTLEVVLLQLPAYQTN